MKNTTQYTALLVAVIGVSAAVAVAPPAGAVPHCTTTAPNTTQCETNGSTQIVTSPPQNNYPYPYGGFPIIGFGGWGFGII